MVVKETFQIEGMTCRMCEKALEKAMYALSGMKSAEAEYSSGKMTVEFDDARCTREMIKKSVALAGYQVNSEGKHSFSAKGSVALLFVILALFCLFRHSGLINIFSFFPEVTEGMSYAALFLIGLLTSVHCIAMCGGLNLTQSLKNSSGKTLRPSIPTWKKQSFACLSSRFVYGETISREKLSMVDRAEQLLLDLGFHQVRVRIHAKLARIEVMPEEFTMLLENQKFIIKELKNYGFIYVTMDLQGYRTGSMNETLKA